MKSILVRTLCRFLVASITTLSIASASAGMIGAEALAPGEAPSTREVLAQLVSRADVARELEARGIDPQVARERVAALSDREVEALKGRVDALPAGAALGPDPGAVFLGSLIIAIVIAILVKIFKDSSEQAVATNPS